METEHAAWMELKGVEKRYRSGTDYLAVLRGVDLKIYPGDFIVILGKSGSGKTTLLHIMAGVLVPDSGQVLAAGKPLGTSERELCRHRRNGVGLVLQEYGLIEELTVLENVKLAARMVHSRIRPEEMLARVGLQEKGGAYPKELSGGEKQRAAIARALVKEPRILLCDEPTGALDRASGEMVMQELKLAGSRGQTVVLITHDEDHVRLASRAYVLEEGRLKPWEG